MEDQGRPFSKYQGSWCPAVAVRLTFRRRIGLRAIMISDGVDCSGLALLIRPVRSSRREARDQSAPRRPKYLPTFLLSGVLTAWEAGARFVEPTRKWQIAAIG